MTNVQAIPSADTSVAVAHPSTTAVRMAIGSDRAGSARRKVRPTSPHVAGSMSDTSTSRNRHQHTAHSVSARMSAGSRPPMNRSAIETPATTDPSVMSTSDGGIVSDMAPDADSSATSSPGL